MAAVGSDQASVDRAYTSYWAKSTEPPDYPPLSGELECDVAVVGAGIVGVTTALRLAREGARVALLEARWIGSGATGYTTAKLSSLHGLSYDRLERSIGAGTARAYGEANQSGLNEIASLAEGLSIDCDFRRKPNFTYTESESSREAIMDEAAAAKRAGLPASFVTDAGELPYPVAAAVRVSDQAEFHPLAYLNGLAAAAADFGCTIHQGSRVVAIDQGDPCRVQAEEGTVTAGHVIVATHMPILDRGLYFARTHPERSYVVMARLGGEVPEGMYLSDESRPHSLRSVPTRDGEVLLVAGESHKTGQSDAAERFRELERWARERFDVTSIEHRWATQDNMPADGLPFVGRLWPFSDRILTATGLRKWGLAMGTAAAGMLTDQVLGRESRWGPVFTPMRLHPLAGGIDFVKENANAGLHFVVDRVTRRGHEQELEPGEGAVVGSGLSQQAVYRDEQGELHRLSARCTHLGCIVNFNGAERTWDCPCHGSRFAATGEVLEGPAVRPLPRRD